MLAGSVLLTLAANLAEAQPTVWGRICAGVPAGAFLLAVALIERRGSQPALAEETQEEPVSEPVQDEEPVIEPEPAPRAEAEEEGQEEGVPQAAEVPGRAADPGQGAGRQAP
ncbi:hypothetical protein GCM10022254_76220 [Actinomadura meridiana]|uniref:Uncharacterized protein n=1 Tax=Actinomadura meridiana TaxID=559626 RepID=A0ABP8CRM7_9ACTN